MIRSRNGTISIKQFKVSSKEKSFDASINNYKCLFCSSSMMILNIHDAKCSCGSQWWEKNKGKKPKVCEAV
jgi:DNA-directed RNA polymerase subunit RPC12/RpoP